MPTRAYIAGEEDGEIFFTDGIPRGDATEALVNALTKEELARFLGLSLRAVQTQGRAWDRALAEYQAGVDSVYDDVSHDVWEERDRAGELTRSELERAVREAWEEAYKADPHRTMENTIEVLGRDTWVWGNLSVRDLRALRRAIFPTILEARG